MKTKTLKIWLSAARPKTLPAAIAPVLIGIALAYYTDTTIQPLILTATFAAAILIQIGTNFANDYYDHKKGADTETRTGPIRATQAGLITPTQMKFAFAATFAAAALIGLYLVCKGGTPILIIGIASIICGLLYTAGPAPIAYLGLGEIFVMIFFGPVAVAGTYYLQTKSINPTVIIASLAPAFISTAILAVNNLRDIATDTPAGKKTLAVRLGPKFAKTEYTACMLAPIIILAALVAINPTHYKVLLSLHYLLLSIGPIITVWSNAQGDELNQVLAKTGRALLLYSIIFAITWNR